MSNEQILALLTLDERSKAYANITGIITNWLRSAGIEASEVKAFCSVEAIGAEIANAFLVPMIRARIGKKANGEETAAAAAAQQSGNAESSRSGGNQTEAEGYSQTT